MIAVERRVRATPKRVFDVLSDGWLYPLWVVGASRIRAVDTEWPQVGSRIHHSFGVWPFVIDDTTHVTVFEPEHRMGLAARAWPAGEAGVDIEVVDDGDPGGCRVVIREDASKGPGRLIPAAVRQMFIAPRNVETLKRLAYLAEGRG